MKNNYESFIENKKIYKTKLNINGDFLKSIMAYLNGKSTSFVNKTFSIKVDKRYRYKIKFIKEDNNSLSLVIRLHDNKKRFPIERKFVIQNRAFIGSIYNILSKEGLFLIFFDSENVYLKEEINLNYIDYYIKNIGRKFIINYILSLNIGEQEEALRLYYLYYSIPSKYENDSYINQLLQVRFEYLGLDCKQMTDYVADILDIIEYHIAQCFFDKSKTIKTEDQYILSQIKFKYNYMLKNKER